MGYFDVFRFCMFFIVFLGLDFTLFSLVISVLCLVPEIKDFTTCLSYYRYIGGDLEYLRCWNER